MIERYTLPEMGRVWSEAHKYELWCRVEVLVLEAQARAGTVPAESVDPVRSALPPTPEAVGVALSVAAEMALLTLIVAAALAIEQREAVPDSVEA